MTEVPPDSRENTHREGESPRDGLRRERQRELLLADHKVQMACALNGFDSFDDLLADWGRLKRMEIMWGTAGPPAPGLLAHKPRGRCMDCKNPEPCLCAYGMGLCTIDEVNRDVPPHVLVRIEEAERKARK